MRDSEKDTEPVKPENRAITQHIGKRTVDTVVLASLAVATVLIAIVTALLITTVVCTLQTVSFLNARLLQTEATVSGGGALFAATHEEVVVCATSTPTSLSVIFTSVVVALIAMRLLYIPVSDILRGGLIRAKL